MSMNFLVEGYGTLPPFNKEGVDVRDSLSFQLKRGVEKMNVVDREELSGVIGYCCCVGGRHVLNNKEGMDGLRFLCPENILLSVSGTIVISVADLSGIENHRIGLLNLEYIRYSSPEMISGETSESSEKTVVFSLGMIMYSILNQDIPFSGMSEEMSGKMIVSGERPSMERIISNHEKWVEMIENCWKQKEKERPGFVEVEKEIVKLSPKAMDKVNKKKKKKKKKKTLKRKEEEGTKDESSFKSTTTTHIS
jgi:hypothetical protein